MAKYTRLGAEGYGVRRAGSFAGKVAATVIILVQLANVSVEDAVVTALAGADVEVTSLALNDVVVTGVVTGVDAVVTSAALDDVVVTGVTLTEWPV